MPRRKVPRDLKVRARVKAGECRLLEDGEACRKRPHALGMCFGWRG